jgi:CO dehydrogenase/acetyl-CoA synthase beta subunit
MARQLVKKSVESRLTAVERGIRSLQANDAKLIVIVEGLQSGFARMEGRLDEIYNHIDGFMKLHETLDIEFKVMKEHMKRLEERVARLEAS